MGKIKPEKVAEMLRNRGVEISVVQATEVLKLLKKIANIIVSDHLENARKQKKQTPIND